MHSEKSFMILCQLFNFSNFFWEGKALECRKVWIHTRPDLLYRPRPRGYKTFSMLNSAEPEFILLINVKMPTIDGILTFISRINAVSDRLKSCILCNFWSFNFRTNVSIFQEHSKKLIFRYTFYQFRKSKQIISIKTTAFTLKLPVYNYWRDANNYQHKKNTPVL